MTTVKSGLNHKGEPCEFYMNILLNKDMIEVRKVVKEKDFDYVAIIAGLPGMGKSNFAINLAKFCDENFNIKNIAMTADEFIELTTTLPKGSAVILDESFASMNSRISTSKDFLRIINHLQLIRQRNLFVFLCLPNFFDLGKPISIYRSMNLFIVYGSKFGDRGDFAAYNRNKKRNLYVKGIKYMNYMVETPNYRGKFYRQKAIDDKEYEKKKFEHLRENDRQLKEKKTISRAKTQLHKAINALYETKQFDYEQLSDMFEISKRTMSNIRAKFA